MSIHLPVDLEESILNKVESGRYPDSTEVIRTALRLLDVRDRRTQELRESIAEGLAAIERGEGIVLTPEVMQEIEREAEERVRQSIPPKPDVCP